MRLVNDAILSEEVWLCPYLPDWRAGVEARLRVVTETERGLTGRESRRAYGASLRVEQRWEAVLDAAQAAALRNALQDTSIEQRPVWFPWWPGTVDDVGDYGEHYESAQVVRWAADGSAELVADVSGVGVRWAPALRGYFVEPPRVEAITDELFVARFRVAEAGPAELGLRVTGSDLSWGPAVGGRGYRLFPARPEWRGTVETGGAEVELESRELGFGRGEARAVYPQVPERPLKFSLSLPGADAAADVLGLWAEARGSAGAFWCPTWLAEARLRADVPTGATVLPVTGGDRLANNAYVALVGRSGALEVHGVSSATEAEITLAEPLVAGYGEWDTSVCTAALVRWAKSALTVRWASTDEADATVELREVPSEYYTPVDEVHGLTVGTLPEACYLYKYSIAYPGGDQVWRYTSYESEVTYVGQPWAPAQMEHGDIRETLNLESNEVQVRARAAEGSPLLRFVPFRLEFPLRLEIWEGQLLAGSVTTAQRLFIGEVSRVSLDGPYVTARATQVGNLFERKLPRVLLQPTCNYALFDVPCGLSAEAWRYTGEVHAVLDNPARVQVSNLVLASANVTVPPAHWFSGGWIELGSGADFESRFIADNTAYPPGGGGWLELELTLPLGRVPAVGEVVALWPGCDGKLGTCTAKFANAASFGGFPWMPTGNPSMLKMPANRTGK